MLNTLQARGNFGSQEIKKWRHLRQFGALVGPSGLFIISGRFAVLSLQTTILRIALPVKYLFREHAIDDACRRPGMSNASTGGVERVEDRAKNRHCA